MSEQSKPTAPADEQKTTRRGRGAAKKATAKKTTVPTPEPASEPTPQPEPSPEPTAPADEQKTTPTEQGTEVVVTQTIGAGPVDTIEQLANAKTASDVANEERARVTVNDPAADRRKDEQKEADKVAEQRRLAHVQALETEREFLKRQPAPNERRLADVEKELDRYSSSPRERRRELAADTPRTSVTSQHAQGVPDRTPSTPVQQSAETA